MCKGGNRRDDRCSVPVQQWGQAACIAGSAEKIIHAGFLVHGGNLGLAGGEGHGARAVFAVLAQLDIQLIFFADAERLGRVISDFVRSLPTRRQFIFVSRYYLAEPIDTIAKDLSLSRSMINKELASIRNALRERLESEGYLI